MTRRQKATEQGLTPHWKVRLVLPNALLHLASWDEPRWEVDEDGQRVLMAEWIDNPEYGDKLISIDWTAVTAVTARWSE